MSVRIAIVGPGRVGSAFGRRLIDAGCELLGFVGRDPAHTAAAIAFAGGGVPLQLGDLLRAHVVLVAVGDPDLPGVVAAASASGAGRSCALWLHTSGRHGLEVLQPLTGAGIRRGALHPAAPFPDAATGLLRMTGSPAVLLGEPRARRLLLRLCEWLELQPLWGLPGGDRTLYHAACALAANGLTALRSAVDGVLARAGALAPADAAQVAQALMAAALQACGERSPQAALSGPVVRGDAATVAAHRAALLALGGGADDVYRALMQQALQLALARGLPESAASALRRALGAAMD